jgi:hypothetical protein
VVELPGWASPFEHVKVHKDQQGQATEVLRIGGGTLLAADPDRILLHERS